jgi:hypothetical protein
MHKDCVLCELEPDVVYLIYVNVYIHRSCHDSGAGISPRRSGFCPRPVYVEFVVDKVPKVQGFLQIFQFFHQCAIVTFILNCSYQKGKRTKPIKLQI